MSVTYEQSLADFYDWIEHQRSKRKREYPLRAIITLVILGYGFLERGQTLLAWVLIAVAVTLAAGPLLEPWQQRAWRRRIALQEETHTALPDDQRNRKTVTLEETGIRVSEPLAKREVLHFWSGVSALVELERLIVVQVGHESLMIPRRAFESPEALAAFLTELRGKMPAGEAEETPTGES